MEEEASASFRRNSSPCCGAGRPTGGVVWAGVSSLSSAQSWQLVELLEQVSVSSWRPSSAAGLFAIEAATTTGGGDAVVLLRPPSVRGASVQVGATDAGSSAGMDGGATAATGATDGDACTADGATVAGGVAAETAGAAA